MLFIAFFIISFSQAQPNAKVYYEEFDNGYHIYADNEEYCPITIKIDFSTINLNGDNGNNNVYVVNSQEDKQLLTTLKVSNKKNSYKFSYEYQMSYGDLTKDDYDKNHRYYLPFKSSNKFNIHQGYNGSFSHQNENALDFTMPVGTEITAVREGIVVKVIDKNHRNCPEERCKKYNNLILIYHPDGTFAEYAHIKQNGSNVKIGEQVDQGQLIGYSGNVGWTTGPHLHLVIFKQKFTGRKTLKTKFKTGDGHKNEYLIENKTYSRNY